TIGSNHPDGFLVTHEAEGDLLSISRDHKVRNDSAVQWTTRRENEPGSSAIHSRNHQSIEADIEYMPAIGLLLSCRCQHRDLPRNHPWSALRSGCGRHGS